MKNLNEEEIMFILKSILDALNITVFGGKEPKLRMADLEKARKIMKEKGITFNG